MPATRTSPPHLVGDRVQVRHHGQLRPGRIRSVHQRNSGIEYVINTDPVDGGMGEVVNVWTTSGRSLYQAPAAEGGSR